MNREKFFYKTQEQFEKDKEAGKIPSQAIVFVKNPPFVWTHNTYFTYDGEIIPHQQDIKIITQEEYDQMEHHQKDVLYFIINEPLDEE